MDNLQDILSIDCSYISQEIAPDLFLTNGRNPSPQTYKGTNVYFLGASNTKILIDAGDKIPEYEQNLDLIIKTLHINISHVIITHQHHDHTEGLLYILKRFPSIKIYKFKAEGNCLVNDENLEKKLGFQYTYVKDEEILKIDQFELEIIHIPGHSSDSIGIYDPLNKRFFVGDTILGEGTGTSITDLSLYFTSIKKILNLEIECLLPAHGNVIFKKENIRKLVNMFLENRIKREREILTVLKERKRVEFEELFKEVYKVVVENLVNTAKNNLQVHINKLISEDIFFSQFENNKTFINLKEK